MLPCLLRRQRGLGFAGRLVAGQIQLCQLLAVKLRQRFVDGGQLCRDLLCGVCRHFLRQRVEESLCGLYCRVGLRSFLRLVQQFAVGAASIGGLGLRLLRAVAANAPGGSRDRHRGWTMSQLNKRFFIGLRLRSLPLSGGVPGWGLLSFLLTIALLRRFAADFAGNVGLFCLKCTVPPPQCAGCSLSQRSFFV